MGNPHCRRAGSAGLHFAHHHGDHRRRVTDRSIPGIVGYTAAMRTVLTRFACLALLAAPLLQGCGQKGPLYRPDEQAQTVGEESVTNGKKKSDRTLPPAPQTQKVPTPTEPSTPPSVDPDRPADPPPGN
jgi:predicted small lipoprotein YifL